MNVYAGNVNHDRLKTCSSPEGFLSLAEPIGYLLAANCSLGQEDQIELGKNVETLITWISSHHIHLALGGFRKVNDPAELTFDILNCSLGEFEDNCNAYFMAVAAKLAIIALVEGRELPKAGCKVLSLTVSEELNLDHFVDCFKEDTVKARIKFVNIHS